VLRRAAPVIRRQAYVQVPPARLFGEAAIALHGRLDHVLLVASHDRDEVDIEEIDGQAVAAQMRASLDEERNPFLQVYRQFRFLFPERRSAVVERASAIDRELLQQYLADRPAHRLLHPYPVRLDSLVGPVESVLRRTTPHRPADVPVRPLGRGETTVGGTAHGAVTSADADQERLGRANAVTSPHVPCDSPGRSDERGDP